jgi:hypothetical protein
MADTVLIADMQTGAQQFVDIAIQQMRCLSLRTLCKLLIRSPNGARIDTRNGFDLKRIAPRQKYLRAGRGLASRQNQSTIL